MHQVNEEHAACLLRLQAKALDAAANTIVITDRQGAIIWVNRAAEQTYGYSRAEMLGKNPRLFQSGLHDQSFYAKLWGTVLSGEVWSGLIFNRSRNGDLIQEQMTITPVSDRNAGLPTHFIAIKQNVTEHKRLEEALLLREFAVENSADAVFIARPDGGLVYVNDSACRLLGAERSQLLSLELGAEHPGQAFAARWKDLRQQRSITWEANFRNPQGDAIPVEISLNYIAKERREYACAFVRDVGDRRRAERALRLIVEGTAAKTGREFFRSCARQLALVLDVRYTAVTSIEPLQSDGSATPHVPKTAKMLAFWAEGFLDLEDYRLAGTPCEEVIRTRQRQAFHNVPKQFPAAHALIGMGVQSYEGLPLLDSAGKVIGHLSVMDDKALAPDSGRESILRIFSARAGAEVERLRTLETLEHARRRADAASEAKGHFLASISHELRTPLNGILGYAQILERDDTLSEKQLGAIRVIGSSGEHLLELINDVLDLSRVEAHKLELTPVAFRLDNLLQTVERVFAKNADEKGLTFRCELGLGLPGIVFGDERRLRQVLFNLVDNAVKFTERGHVMLRVEAADGDGVRFEVHDSGSGIDSSELQRIFDPFQQARSKMRHHSGTGLGLAISKRLVELMCGELHLHSEPGVGSCFSFEIPLAPADDAGSRQVDLMQARITGYRGRRRKLLVVDDRPHNRDLLRSMLEGLGFTVRESASGGHAVKLATEFEPDLVLVEQRMPDMDGGMVAQRMRAGKRRGELAMVLLAATDTELDRQALRLSGWDDQLSKPIRISELLDVIGRLLGLDWISEMPSSTEMDQLFLPSSQQLGELLALCTVGDVVALRERVEVLRQSEPRYGPFAGAVLELLSQFKIKALRERLRTLLAQKDQRHR